MEVESITIEADLFSYENSTNTVLKSDYGVFIFTREGDLEGCEGRIQPYMVDFLSGEELIESNVSLPAYSTEDEVLIPLYEASNIEPGRCFVIDESYVIRLGGIQKTAPNKLDKTIQSSELVEFYTTPQNPQPYANTEFVKHSVIAEIFENSFVERVIVA